MGLGLLLLIVVAVAGDIGKGAQRWLDLGFIRFQPSEIMKLAVPICLRLVPARAAAAARLHDAGRAWRSIMLVPTLLIAEQPDLGTALLVTAGGGLVILLAGLQLRYILGLGRRWSRQPSRSSGSSCCTTTSASACSRS